MKRLYVGLLILASLFIGCRGSRPTTPLRVEGPVWVRLDSTASFAFQTTDPEGKEVSYRLEWGSGDTSEWTGWFQSGAEVMMQHAWSARGNHPVRVQAQDGLGNRSDWSDPLTVHVLPEPGYPTVRATTIVLPFEPSDLVASPDGQYVFAACEYDDVLGVIRTSDNSFSEVPCIAMSAMTMTPDGRYLLGRSDYDENLCKVRLPDYAIAGTAYIGNGAEGFAVTPSGKFLYVTYEDEDSSCLLVFRVSDLEQVAVVDLGDFYGPVAVAFSRDGRYAYVSLYELGSVAVVRTEDNALVGTIPVHSYPVGLAALPGKDYLYVANSEGMDVSVIRTTDNRAVALVPIPGDWSWFEQVYAAPSSEFVYVPDEDNGIIHVIGTSGNTVIGGIRYAGYSHLAPLPDGSRIYWSDGDKLVVLGFESAPARRFEASPFLP